ENSYRYLEVADGCSMEDWVVQGSGLSAQCKLGHAWKSDLDLFQGVNDRGKWSLPILGAGFHDSGVNRYGIASALLIWSGDRSCVDFWKGTAEEALAGRFATSFPEASCDLGRPQGPYRLLPSGVARRDFDNGIVLVNPSDAPQVVPLDKLMRGLDGAP